MSVYYFFIYIHTPYKWAVIHKILQNRFLGRKAGRTVVIVATITTIIIATTVTVIVAADHHQEVDILIDNIMMLLYVKDYTLMSKKTVNALSPP